LQGFSQKSLVSYEDIKFVITKKDNNTKNRKYALTLPGGTHNNISLRVDGKRLFIEIETNELNQYNLIRESISQYLLKDSMAADVQSYAVKELGNIYITVNDTMPYDPMRKDYDIQVVGDKHITAYN